MIQFSIFWVLTLLITMINDKINGMRICKIVSDRGYKFTNKNESAVSENTILQIIIMLIPVVNMFASVLNTLNIKQTGNELLNYYFENELVEKMDKAELKAYSNNPTMVNAHKIYMDNQLNKKSTPMAIKYENNIIEFVHMFNDIIILDVKGNIKNNTEEEIYEILYEVLYDFEKSIDEKYGNIKEFYSNLDNNTTVELGDKKVTLSDGIIIYELKNYTKKDKVKKLTK